MRKCFLIAGALVGVVAAKAQVMDFQSLEHVDSSIVDHGSTYSEDGFVLTQGVGEPFGLSTFGTLESRYPGSTAMFNNTVSGLTRLNKVGGGSFSLTSIALDWLNGGGTVSVHFEGDKTGGGTASDTFALDGASGLETFLFNSDFASVTEVRWTQDSDFHQFDDITMTPVPEPFTMGLAGVALVAAARRRLRKTA